MKIRSFLAFDIPEEIKEELASVVGVLEPKAKGVRWVKPQNVHCTIKFFGNVEEELLLGDLSRTIENAVVGHAPIHLTSIGIGVFPNWRYPRIIWAGLAGETEAAAALYQRLAAAFHSFELHEDKRDVFRLHLTLGRAKTPLKNCEPLVSLVEKLADHEFGKFIVDHLTLYKSVLTREGAVYTALREFKLGGKNC